MFDCPLQGKLGLKDILENKKILKILHDCRNDWESLINQYNVRLYNFIDTQECYYIFKLFFYREITQPISLSNMLQEIIFNNPDYIIYQIENFNSVIPQKSNFSIITKQVIKEKMKNNYNIWGERPLSEEMLFYASEDVGYLIDVWKYISTLNYFNENLKELVYFLSIIKVIDSSLFYQFKEYLECNMIYYNSLDDVFFKTSCESMLFYHFFINDHLFNFLQIKINLEKIDTEIIKSNYKDQKSTDNSEYEGLKYKSGEESKEEQILNAYQNINRMKYKKSSFHSDNKETKKSAEIEKPKQLLYIKNQLTIKPKLKQEVENIEVFKNEILRQTYMYKRKQRKYTYEPIRSNLSHQEFSVCCPRYYHFNSLRKNSNSFYHPENYFQNYYRRGNKFYYRKKYYKPLG